MIKKQLIGFMALLLSVTAFSQNDSKKEKALRYYNEIKSTYIADANKRYNSLKLNFQQSSYFNTKDNYSPKTNNDDFGYRIINRDFESEFLRIIDSISFDENYTDEKNTSASLNWNNKAKVFDSYFFSTVGRFDIRINTTYNGSNATNGNEIKGISNISHVEIGYSYSFPKNQIDSLEVDFSTLQSKKINGEIYLEKFSKNGLIMDFVGKSAATFLLVKTFDDKGKELFCRPYDRNVLYTRQFFDENNAAFYKKMVEAESKINSNADLDELMKLDPIANRSTSITNFLLSLAPQTKKVVLYFSPEKIEKTGVRTIYKKNSNTNEHFGVFSSSDPKTYDNFVQFVDKKNKKILPEKYHSISEINDSFFSVYLHETEKQKAHYELFGIKNGSLENLNVFPILLGNDNYNNVKANKSFDFKGLPNKGILAQKNHYGDIEKSVLIGPQGTIIKSVDLNNEGSIDYYKGFLVLESKKGFQLFDDQLALSETFDKISICGKVMQGKLIVEKNGFRGVTDLKGKLLLPVEYQDCDCMMDSYLIKKNNAYSLIRKDKKGIDLSQYSEVIVSNPITGVLLVKSDNAFKIFNTNTEKISDFEFDAVIEEFDDLNFTVEKNAKTGLLDSDGKLVVPFNYDEIIQTRPHYYVAIRKLNKGLQFDFYNDASGLLTSHKSNSHEIYKLVGVFSLILDDTTYINYKGEITSKK